MAKKKLTSAEQFYVEQNPKNLGLSDLAEELGLPESSIKPFFIQKTTKNNNYSEIDTDGMHPLAKGSNTVRNRNVTIMTPAHSEQADSTRAERTGKITEIMKTSVHPCRKKS